MTNEQMDTEIAKHLMNYVVTLGTPRFSAADGNTYYFRGRRHWWEDDCGPMAENWSPSTDLRACAEAEQRLSPEQASEYAEQLDHLTHREPPAGFYSIGCFRKWRIATATPAQRSAALLAVLKGGK